MFSGLFSKPIFVRSLRILSNFCLFGKVWGQVGANFSDATLPTKRRAYALRRVFRNDEQGLPAIVAQYDARSARCDQLAAEFLKVSAVVVSDADVVADFLAQSYAAVPNDDRLAIAD